MTQLVFFDTEFSSLMDPRLISLGAITEDGKHEFYVEISDYNRKFSSEFVKNTVEPLLDIDKFGKTHLQAGAAFATWLEELGPVELCPDYADDWNLAIDLLDDWAPENFAKEPTMYYAQLQAKVIIRGTQLNVPDLMQYYNDMRKLCTEVQLDYFFRNRGMQHHALHDAKANREAYLAVMKEIGL